MKVVSLSAQYQPVFEPNRFGGRLKYVGRAADSHYWDGLWAQLSSTVDYTRYRRGHLPHQLRRTFRRWVAPGAHVLEAGCGLATFTVAACALGYRAEGVDYAPDVIEKLRTRFEAIPFFVGDVRHLTAVGDGAYDAVYSPGVCEHFESGPEDVLREAHRILRPGGMLIASTPCFNALQRLLRTWGWYEGPAPGAFYQYAFTRDELASVLDGIGFDIVQIHQYGTLLTLRDHWPVLGRLLPNGLAHYLAAALDAIPLVRRIGHTCIWVGRKR